MSLRSDDAGNPIEIKYDLTASSLLGMEVIKPGTRGGNVTLVGGNEESFKSSFYKFVT